MVIQTTLLPLAQLAKNDGQIEGLPANPRIIKDEKYQKLVASIKENPEMLSLRELLVYKHDAHYIIIGGNMRYSAMRELGYEEAPCKIIPEETTVEQLRAYTLKDNSGYGEWDWDMLSGEWEMDELEAAGIDLPFLDGEDHPTNTEAADIEEDDFDEEKDPVATICQEGDVWQLGEHRLMCGDSTKAEDVARLMDGELADLWLTDPPYNVGYGMEGSAMMSKRKHRTDGLVVLNDKQEDSQFHKFLVDAFSAANNSMKSGASFYIWHADQEGYNFRSAVMEVGLKCRQCLIWNKDALCLGRQDYQWKHEPCLYGWKEGAAHNWYSDRKQTTVIDWQRPKRSEEHPTMKPIGLFGYQISNSSKPGDIVLDTFGGSGTTIIACENLGRKARCVELDPHYCDVIIARWEKLTGKEAVKL